MNEVLERAAPWGKSVGGWILQGRGITDTVSVLPNSVPSSGLNSEPVSNTGWHLLKVKAHSVVVFFLAVFGITMWVWDHPWGWIHPPWTCPSFSLTWEMAARVVLLYHSGHVVSWSFNAVFWGQSGDRNFQNKDSPQALPGSSIGIGTDLRRCTNDSSEVLEACLTAPTCKTHHLKVTSVSMLLESSRVKVPYRFSVVLKFKIYYINSQ